MKTTLTLLAIVCSTLSLHSAELRTLRSFGAVGDGNIDDRAAIEQAIASSKGAPLDGEGATYAVHGNIQVNGPIDLRRATFQQTMGPADVSQYLRSVHSTTPPKVEPPTEMRAMVNGLPQMGAKGIGTYDEDPVLSKADLAAVLPSIALRTLLIRGTEQQPVPVRLTSVKVLRGDHPETGGRSDGMGIGVEYGSPVSLEDVEITGDGKGIGLQIKSCAKVRLQRLSIHDIHWALYGGDFMPPVESLKMDWGWTNNPIYEFRAGLNRFVRVRIQEQLSGLFIVMSQDVEVLDSTIARLGTMLEGKFYPWQADGMTINRNKNIVIRNCHISDVWEGIDFTGAGGDGFTEENVTITDTFSYGFKYAHNQRNGTVTNCTSIRAGMVGFIMGDECDNIVFKGCRALETGASGYWTRGEVKPNVSGFRLIGSQVDKSLPRGVRIENCTAINKEFPGAMAYGFNAELNAIRPGQNNELIGPVAEGFKQGAVKGFPHN